jgi:ankyrin repeat protein
MISHAISRNNAETLQFVLAFKGAKRLLATKNQLFMALKRGTSKIAEILLEAGAPIDHVTKDGETCLTHACATGNEQVASKLLEAGLDPNQNKNNQPSLLCKAIVRRDVRMVQMLLDHGANILVSNAMSRSPFGMAINTGQKDIIEALVQRGVLDTASNDEYHSYMLICGPRIIGIDPKDLEKSVSGPGSDPNIPVQDSIPSSAKS